jgi:hypothetical protein
MKQLNEYPKEFVDSVMKPWSFETYAVFQRTTRRFIPNDRTLNNHLSENLKSYINMKVKFSADHSCCAV